MSCGWAAETPSIIFGSRTPSGKSLVRRLPHVEEEREARETSGSLRFLKQVMHTVLEYWR